MTRNLIKSFSVYGLFGTNDVHIPFDENIKILVGENGLGKTQVLNIFYYTLTQNFFRLSEFHFDKLILEFSKGDPIEIKKDDINRLVEKLYKHPAAKELISELGFSQFEIIRNKIFRSKGNWRRFEGQFFGSKTGRKYPVHLFYELFESEIKESKGNESGLNKLKKRIQSAISITEILYFPTFRRVEEDLHNFGYDEDDFLNQEDIIIQFGMHDVSRKFKSIENKIDRLLKEGFSKISSEILSQLVKGFSLEEDSSCLDKIDKNDIEIILARVGSQLPEDDKTAMREIVVNKKITNPSLMYFLKKLIEIYENQKELDNSVKVFRDICNKYLIGKKVFYDESAIKIFIKSDITKEEIDLKYLSSGEKQIISMFSKIYLSEEKKRFMVLFDEPELSLSILWQRQLLPDIIHSNKCDFLLAVTHSPFIFDNELDQYAIGMSEYIKPSKMIAA